MRYSGWDLSLEWVLVLGAYKMMNFLNGGSRSCETCTLQELGLELRSGAGLEACLVSGREITPGWRVAAGGQVSGVAGSALGLQQESWRKAQT